MGPQFSVRTYLYITIVLMGSVGLTLALAFGNTYKEDTLRVHQNLLSELITRQTTQRLDALERETSDLAFALQSEARFVEQIKSGNTTAMENLLYQQYQRQFADDGIIRLHGLAVFDTDLTHLASSRKNSLENASGAACVQLINEAKKRKGLNRTKVFSGFCTHDNHPEFAVIVPMGGFTPFAYLYLETDTVPALAQLETEVGMPISLTSEAGAVLFKSTHWKEDSDNTAYVITHYRFSNNIDSPQIIINAAYDARSFNETLKNSRNLMMGIAAIATLFMVLIISFSMQLTVVRPLHALTKKLRMLRKDKSQLGEQVQVSGNAEVNQLADEFNSMTVELKHIYGELENMALTADIANRAKSAFLANMSHEIRTPLTSIIGFAEMSISDGQSESEKRLALKMIAASGKHLLNIINDILDLSKIEADKLEVEKIPVSPLQILNDVRALVEMQAKEKGLEFTLNPIFPLSKTIISDPLRIKQILLNLCSNAIKFTSKGHVKINVFMDQETQTIHFEIEDTGIGLTEEQIERIFHAFNQADASTTRQFGGTGLGLSLSKKLAQMLGGDITVASTPQHGSMFSVTLSTGPIKQEDLIYTLQTPTPIDDKESFPTPRSRQFVRGRILLVEDNLVNQMLITKLLQNTGADVTVVDNGQKGVDEAIANDYDLIFMDLQMPVMDGMQATRLLRAQAYAQPIVALTANTMKEDRDKCMAIGFNDFISKPIDQQQLQDVVNHYLNPKI